MTTAFGQEGQPAGDAAGPGPASLDLTVGAEWVAASLVRQRVTAWLAGLGWPVAEAEELVLAVSEAVSNSVEHGYLVAPDAIGHPGLVHVRGRVVTAEDGDRRVLLTVRDGGRWREPRNGPSSRGHGMVIMRTCAERFAVEHGPAGTTVEMVSRPV